MKHHWLLAITVGTLALAACSKGGDGGTVTGANPDSITVNGVTYIKSGSTPAGPGSPAATTAMSMPGTGVPAAAPGAAMPGAPAVGANPLIGRWTTVDERCGKGTIIFTDTAMTMMDPRATRTNPVTYSDITPTSVTITGTNAAGRGQTMPIMLGGPNQITIDRCLFSRTG